MQLPNETSLASARRRGPVRRVPDTKPYTVLLEPEIAEAVKKSGSLSELVRSLLRQHCEAQRSAAAMAANEAPRRKLTGRGFLAGGPSIADELMARKAYEKDLEG